MKQMLRIAVLSIGLAGGELMAYAGGLYDVHDTPYTTYIAKKPGDLLTVVVDEVADVKDNGSRSQNRKNESGFSLKKIFFPGVDLADGLTKTNGSGDPLGMDWESENKFEASAANKSDHQFTTTIQVRLIEEVANDQFVIRGHKQVNLNGKQRTVFLSGVIRQRDIAPDNSIRSSKIADSLVEIDGEVGSTDVRPGLLMKAMNFLF